MDRFGWMVVRAYLPALLALVLAVVCMFWTSLFGEFAPLRALVPWTKWLPPILLLAALVAGLATTLRLWRWKQGELPVCPGCGGPMGRVHHAAGGDWRKCQACGGKQCP